MAVLGYQPRDRLVFFTLKDSTDMWLLSFVWLLIIFNASFKWHNVISTHTRKFQAVSGTSLNTCAHMCPAPSTFSPDDHLLLMLPILDTNALWVRMPENYYLAWQKLDVSLGRPIPFSLSDCPAYTIDTITHSHKSPLRLNYSKPLMLCVKRYYRI